MWGATKTRHAYIERRNQIQDTFQPVGKSYMFVVILGGFDEVQRFAFLGVQTCVDQSLIVLLANCYQFFLFFEIIQCCLGIIYLFLFYLQYGVEQINFMT